MRSTRRLVVLLLALLACSFGPAAPVRAAPDEAACECDGGYGACQHFLRNPFGPTIDPCWCDRCRSGKTHDGQTVPQSWNQSCFLNTSIHCYLKRHSAAWRITCSECAQNDACCPQPQRANCPDCGASSAGNPLGNDHQGRPAKATVLERLKKEQAFFKKPNKVIVAYNPHFYLCTDVEPLKVKMPGGSFRLVSTHEWAHLMIERAEYAKRLWVRHLGEPQHLKGAIGMWFTAKQRDQNNVSATYFGSPGSKALGGQTETRIADGFARCGMAFSEQEYSGDRELQVQMRHELAHLLFMTWSSHEIRPKSRPQWAEEGLGHWLVKIVPGFEDEATYCVGEVQLNRNAPQSTRPSWSGKDWPKDCAKIANDKSISPVEKLLAKQVVNELTEDDHKRSWSLVDLGLRELPDKFPKVLADVRLEKDMREVFVNNVGMTPEQFDLRWRDRVTGRRKTLADEPSDAAASADDENSPSARERRSLLKEEDPLTLAAKIRQQGSVKDPKMLKVVLDLLARNDDLVRETALVTLLKTTDPEAVDTLWRHGLGHADPIVRAYAARVCGRLGIEASLPKLLEVVQDKNWFARAEAAVALSRLKHANAMAAMRAMVSGDPAEKAKVAAMDALANFGEDAHMAVPLVLKHLDSPQWQLRVAACQTLGAIGSMEAVEPMITRMETESGRLRGDLRDALKLITRDDLGANPASWRKWWEKEKARAPGGLPKRPDAPPVTGKGPDKPNPDDRYGAPVYYNVEIYSNRIGFVVDTSMSMATLFVPDPAAAKILSRVYTGHDKLTICREEIAQALKAMDPRSHFNIVAFGTNIRSFKSNPVPANPGNVDAATGFLRSLPPNGETNYYDALKAVLDIGDEPDTNPTFKSTPDTITFLTDGEPTKGAITDGDTLVEWYTGLNRYARITTHTITFGLIGIDQKLLREMAERNGGRFTLVPELKQ